MNTKEDYLSLFSRELDEFKSILENSGAHSALKYLNKRTPHRFTGIYSYEGDTLRNIMLYDVFNEELQKGEDTPLEATYCSLLKEYKSFELKNSLNDTRVKGTIITPVISYFGVLIKDKKGNPFGSLCHFDLKPCDEPLNDFPLLEAAAEILYKHFLSKNL